MGIEAAEFEKFRADLLLFRLSGLLLQFHAEHRLLAARYAHSHQRGTEDRWMSVEYAFHRNCKKSLPGGRYTVGFASAEPYPASVVPVADITHAVPDAAVGIGYFCQPGGVGPVQVGAADLRPAHGDLANFQGRKRQGVAPCGYGCIADRNNGEGDAVYRTADTDTMPKACHRPGFGQDFAAADGTDRQRLGCAVGGENFSIIREHCGKAFQYRGRDRSTGGNYPFDMSKPAAVGLAETADPI